MKFSAASGIAIAPILFVIALLAILATAIAAGSSTFSSGSDQESNRTLASSIITVGQQYQAAVARLIAFGCDKDQISFDAAGLPASLANPRAPADHHCDIYSPLGGGMVMRKLPDAAINDPTDDYSQGGWLSSGSEAWKGFPVPIGNGKVTKFGTSGAEMILIYHGLKSGVCSSINTILKRSQLTAYVYAPYAGMLGPHQMDICGGCGIYNYGQPMGCNTYTQAENPQPGTMFYFYAVLLVQ